MSKKIVFKYIVGITTIISIFLCIQVSANQADVLPNFDTKIPVGFNGGIKNTAVQDNGKIIVGGEFTTYQGVAANRIIRLNSDGSTDTSFGMGAGFNDAVYSIVVQDDGKIIVGGFFMTYQGVAANYIIRLNSDGSRDSSFNVGAGFNGLVYAIAIQDDGKIIVGGYNFTTYQGVAANRIIRLNSDGSRDTSFDMGSGFNGTIRSIDVNSSGKIIIAGNFTTYQGVAANYIIRLNSDGSRDSSFGMGSGFNTEIRFIKIQSDGKILVGGSFTTYQGVAANRIIRLNSDGSRDSSFAIGAGFNQDVYNIKIQSDGKILVGGSFTTYQGVSARYLVRLHDDGSRDSSLNTDQGFNAAILTIAIQNNGKIFIGGAFTKYKLFFINYFIRLNSDGSQDDSLYIGNGLDNSVLAIAAQDDGKIVAGGNFNTYQGIAVNKLIRLNTDGSKDDSFNIGIGFNSVTAGVNSLAIQSDGKILVGGSFSTYQGVAANYIIRLNTDGSRDNTFNMGAGFTSYVSAIAIQDDGKIVVGGNFGSYSGVTASKIIRLNSDGSRDTSFDMGTGFNNTVTAIDIHTDGKIGVGGQFTTYQGIPANYIIRLNTGGSRDTSFDMGSGFNTSVSCLTIQSDGKILVGGNFTKYKGIDDGKIIRINTGGSRDTSFSVGSNASSVVQGIVVQNDGKIVVGGRFTAYKNFSSSSIIRLNTDGLRDISFDVGLGFNGYVYALAIKDNQEIVVGGAFTTYKARTAGYLTTIYGNSDLVVIPNSSDPAVVESEFISKGYIKTGGNLVGSRGISLVDVDGNIPVALSVENDNIEMNIPADTQLKQANNITNYSGIIASPIAKSIYSVNDESVLLSFSAGSSSESIKLTGGVVTLGTVVDGINIGEDVNIYASEDNGTSWYLHGTGIVSDNNGDPYVEFTTNHFTDFAITVPVPFSGSFTINNDAGSTMVTGVTLNISTTPAANQMRFSDDGITRPAWENYATTKARTLTGSYGSKTVYAQFDADGDGTSDVTTQDAISYIPEGTAQGRLILEIGKGTGSCQYGTSLDLGVQTASYAAKIFSGAFGSSFRCEDKNGTTASRILSIQASPLINASNSIYTIPAANIELQNTPAYIITGDCAIYVGTTSWTAIDLPRTILGKNNDIGAICKIQSDTVTIKVTTAASQAVGIYTGTLTIDVPNFN